MSVFLPIFFSFFVGKKGNENNLKYLLVVPLKREEINVRRKIGMKFKKILNVFMAVVILVTSIPITPFILRVNSLSKVSGDKIIEAAMSYSSCSYGEVGTCTGLVTRALNKVGVETSIVGTHPYDIDYVTMKKLLELVGGKIEVKDNDSNISELILSVNQRILSAYQ